MAAKAGLAKLRLLSWPLQEPRSMRDLFRESITQDLLGRPETPTLMVRLFCLSRKATGKGVPIFGTRTDAQSVLVLLAARLIDPHHYARALAFRQIEVTPHPGIVAHLSRRAVKIDGGSIQ